jgi:hypothetical protein
MQLLDRLHQLDNALHRLREGEWWVPCLLLALVLPASEAFNLVLRQRACCPQQINFHTLSARGLHDKVRANTFVFKMLHVLQKNHFVASKACPYLAYTHPRVLFHLNDVWQPLDSSQHMRLVVAKLKGILIGVSFIDLQHAGLDLN